MLDMNLMSTRIRRAIRCGDSDRVKSLLNKGVNLNYSSGDFSESPLHEATRVYCAQANIDLLELLVYVGASVNARDHFGSIPLHTASKHSSEYVRILLDAGSCVNSSDNAGRTALFNACMCRCKEALTIVQYLLDRGANVHVREQDGKTALHYICSNNKMHETVRNEIVYKLLYAGLSVNDPDHNQMTPLQYQVALMHRSAERNFYTDFHGVSGLVSKTLVEAGGRLHNNSRMRGLIEQLFSHFHGNWHSSFVTAVNKAEFSDNLEVLNLMMFCVPLVILKEYVHHGRNGRCDSRDQPEHYCPYSVFSERLHSLSFNAPSL